MRHFGCIHHANNTLSWFQILILAVSTFLASAGVSAFNQYFERDLDALMPRTSERPFVTGKLSPSLIWPIFFMLITSSGIMLSYLMINPYSAFIIFLEHFFMDVLYNLS